MNRELSYLINQEVDVKYNYNDEHIFIIGAYIDNIEKEKTLVKCIKKLKEFNIPIILVTHCSIREEIVKLVDYFLSDDKNELLMFERFGEFNIDSLRWVTSGNYTINSYVSFHHDFAALTLIKNSVIFCKNLGKKKLHYFDYDCLIDTKQYSQTFLTDIEYYDIVFGFLFSIKIDLAEKIFINNVTTLENHFSQLNWRFEDFLINGIKKYTNNYKMSNYIDNDKTFNSQAAWLRAGINRNGSFFGIYICVDDKDDLYISLFSSRQNTETPTSGLIYSNIGVGKNDTLLEIKYINFNKFHNLKLGNYDLIKLGKYIKNERVIINYMGVKVLDELLNMEISDYKKRNFIKFN